MVNLQHANDRMKQYAHEAEELRRALEEKSRVGGETEALKSVIAARAAEIERLVRYNRELRETVSASERQHAELSLMLDRQSAENGELRTKLSQFKEEVT